MTAQSCGPPSKEQLAAIEAAFNDLYAGLVEAKRLFDNGDSREGAIQAIESVLKFLEGSTVVRSHGLHAPLVALFDALMNLHDGVVQPILQTVPHSGRGRASAVRDSIKGAVAFTVDRLCATGLPVTSARKLVARTLKEVGLVAGRGRHAAVTERTIRGWQEDVTVDVGRKGQAAQTFDMLQQDIAPASGSDPASIRRELLDRLSDLIRRTRSGEKPS